MNLLKLSVIFVLLVLVAMPSLAQDRLAIDSVKLSWDNSEYELDKIMALNSTTDYKYVDSADVDGFSLGLGLDLPWTEALTVLFNYGISSVSGDAYRYDSNTNYLYKADVGNVDISYEEFMLGFRYDFSSQILGEFITADLIFAPSLSLGYRSASTDTELTKLGLTAKSSESNGNILFGGEAMLGLWWDSVGVGGRVELNAILLDGSGYQLKGTGFLLWSFMQNHAAFAEAGYLGEYYDDSVLGEEISSVYWRIGYRYTF